VDGVCTFCEMAVPLVARLAEKLGLPGNSPQAVDAARDKHSTRAVMKREGLPTPRNMLISEPEDVRKAAEEVGFPAGGRGRACGDWARAQARPAAAAAHG
jgi:carbamoylphosphate synthase large subunit